jgi:hypothetical protein
MDSALKRSYEGITRGKKIFPGLAVLLLWICFFILFVPNTDLYSKGKSNLNYTSITFEKVLEISETEDSDFYFESPDEIDADMGENIYVLDIRRVLKFSKDGNFVRNLVKVGKEPGEVTYISNFYLENHGIIIHSNYPSKVIWMDKDGKLLKEFIINKRDRMDYIHYFSDTYFFYKTESPTVQSDGKFMDIDHIIMAVSPDGKDVSKVFNFPVKEYFVRIGGSTGSLGNEAKLNFGITGGRYLFVSHTAEYKIKCVDLKERKVIKEFGVDYERKKIPAQMKKKYKRGWLEFNGKKFRRPQQIYFSDIEKLLINDKQLWAVTSTVDKEKGRRVDVYNFNGDYLNSFYMNLSGQKDIYKFKYRIRDQHLYLIDERDEGMVNILKYKIGK